MTGIIIWLKNLFFFCITFFKFNLVSPKRTPENANCYRKDTIDGHYRVKIKDVYHDRYTVLRKLGSGQFSTVWLCWDQQNAQFVALKIVKSAHAYVLAASREIQFLKCVQRCQSNNPHNRHKVVQLLDTFLIFSADGRHVCMVFETLGYNLKQMISSSGNKGLPLTSVRSILRQILEALDYLHTTCNIIHTDIKPENICVDVNSKLTLAQWKKAGMKFPSPGAGHEVPVTLVDLGNAYWANGVLLDVIQTLPYRGPEVILGIGFHGFQANADVWSTACVAFELATGRYLFPPASRGKRFSVDEYHLALITGLLGAVPKRMAFESEFSREFFTAEGKLRYDPKVISCGLFERLTGQFQWDASEARQFADFLLPMLAIDPNDRCSAKECLAHKWLEVRDANC